MWIWWFWKGNEFNILHLKLAPHYLVFFVICVFFLFWIKSLPFQKKERKQEKLAPLDWLVGWVENFKFLNSGSTLVLQMNKDCHLGSFSSTVLCLLLSNKKLSILRYDLHFMNSQLTKWPHIVGWSFDNDDDNWEFFFMLLNDDWDEIIN